MPSRKTRMRNLFPQGEGYRQWPPKVRSYSLIQLKISKSMKTLEKEEVSNFMEQHLKNWIFEDNSIKRDLKFGTFIQAFSFMTAIAMEAEKADHHPDWSNSYNKLNIS
jgi:4a-hydroxytetrahydrobiopterin dehydratase